MKLIKGGKSDKCEPDMEEIEAATMRAQPIARQAILRFLLTESKANPDGDGVATAVAMQAGFMTAIVEVGFIAFSTARMEFIREAFVDMVGSIFDDVMRNHEDDA
jgi:hypothetical protein